MPAFRSVQFPSGLFFDVLDRKADEGMMKAAILECVRRCSSVTALAESGYMENAPREWCWQYVFSAAKLCAHPRTGKYARHHLHEASMQRQFKDAVRKAALSKPASCHSLRHSFATSLLQHGSDIRTVQHLMGHASVETTMIYLHLLERPGAGAPSPLDFV